MIYLALLIIILVVCWPWIRQYAARFAARRAEDFIRRQMGMPSRKEEERMRKGRGTRDKGQEGRGARARRHPGHNPADGPIIPKEYAVDVEYTEVREYSSETEISGSDGKRRRKSSEFKEEEQVEDVKFTEIKN